MDDEARVRKKFLRLCEKIDFRLCAMYTWLLRSSLKSCGPDVLLHFPVRFGKPESISLGTGCMIYPRAWINVVTDWKGNTYDGEIRLGDRVGIGYEVQISAALSIVIEDDVAIGRGVVIVDHLHDYRHLDVPIFAAPLSAPRPVRIGKGSFLGAHCMIGPGVQIGEHSLVSANSVVVNDVPAFSMAVGNPARVVRFHSPLSNAPTTPGPAESEHARSRSH
jgi:acetyltransferase-like isoleucine patch superfamily enzyme